MLSYPDRQKFQQVRARWEAAQVTPSKMVGRREKSVAHQPLLNDENAGPGRFRRKLSDGLSFIVNPLSQRKPPQPQQNKNSHLPTTNQPATKVHGPSQTLASPKPFGGGSAILQKSSTQYRLGKSYNEASEGTGSDSNTTPKPLPRSHTMSFIPRPSRRESGSSTTGSDTGTVRRIPICSPDQNTRLPPSKIPTPSPTATIRRDTSVQKPARNNTASDIQKDVAYDTCVAPTNQPHSSVSIWSYTTPILKTGECPPPSLRKPAKNSTMPISPLSPNISWPKNVTFEDDPSRPTYRAHRYTKGLFKIPETSPSHPNTMVPTNSPKIAVSDCVETQRAGGDGNSITSTTRRQNSPVTTQTPRATERFSPEQGSQKAVNTKNISAYLDGNTIAHTRLMGPVNPPTPPSIKTVAPRLSLPHAKVEKNLAPRYPMTPRGRNDAVASEIRVGINREVRLPHSSIYHPPRVRKRVSEPPVPPIPESFKSQSMPLFTKGKIETVTEDRTPLSKPTAAQDQRRERGEGETTQHPTTVHETTPGAIDTHSLKNPTQCGETKPTICTSESVFNKGLPRSFSGPFRLFSSSRLKPNSLPRSGTLHIIDQRANIVSHSQVKSYMPMSYWAGRFQSRFDQWRTEAMAYELHICKDRPESLGSYELKQEDKAACLIFLQLRSLCASSQAADSLWEFEYSYRRIHKLIGKDYDFAPLNPRKHNDSDARNGSIVRAVRRLTPRKSSFVNLLKGKGWNREEMKSPDIGHDHLVQITPGGFSGRER
ncbi:hypothetical protein DM02DRAFT_724592 [Periconia macrospinosa]|uniref:Uncharacterized protein n=1 Tax=Periconia macrospinosa TaxID=97972 RepID=A0A2V1E6Q9_9PLEO|nr:hypothetical protein DM02DRAFT_724592 [Periconia macrospinosa]